MESQPQNPEFKINPENFHPYVLPDNLVSVSLSFSRRSFCVVFSPSSLVKTCCSSIFTLPTSCIVYTFFPETS